MVNFDIYLLIQDKLCTNVKDEECAPVYHVLAHALCLQALCTYEADPSSKVLLPY